MTVRVMMTVIKHISDNELQTISLVHISKEIKTIILQGLRESFKDKIKQHNALISELEQQVKRLQNRIDQTYLDKLDGNWQTKTKEWSAE